MLPFCCSIDRYTNRGQLKLADFGMARTVGYPARKLSSSVFFSGWLSLLGRDIVVQSSRAADWSGWLFLSVDIWYVLIHWLHLVGLLAAFLESFWRESHCFKARTRKTSCCSTSPCSVWLWFFFQVHRLSFWRAVSSPLCFRLVSLYLRVQANLPWEHAQERVSHALCSCMLMLDHDHS